MPRRRFQKLPEERQKAILEIAQQEFAENGYEGASFNQIIQNAGLSKGAMYYYFDDKLDLYVSVLEEVFRVYLELMGLNDGGHALEGDFWPAMREMSLKSWVFTIEHPQLAGVLKGMRNFSRAARQQGRLGELFDESRARLRGLLEVGQAQGQVRQDLPIELLVEIGMSLDEALDDWAIEHLDDLAEHGPEEVIDTLLDLWKRLLAPTGGHS